MQLPSFGRVLRSENKQNFTLFLRPYLGFESPLKVDNFKKKKRLFRFLTQEIVNSTVDFSSTGELHMQATCYLYVLRLRSVLLKLPKHGIFDVHVDVDVAMTLQGLSLLNFRIPFCNILQNTMEFVSPFNLMN